MYEHTSMLQVCCAVTCPGQPLPPVPGWPATRPQCPAAGTQRFRAALTRSPRASAGETAGSPLEEVAHALAVMFSCQASIPCSCPLQYAPVSCQADVAQSLPRHCEVCIRHQAACTQGIPMCLSWHAQHLQADLPGLRLPAAVSHHQSDLSFSVLPSATNLAGHKHLPGPGVLQIHLCRMHRHHASAPAAGSHCTPAKAAASAAR